MVHCVLIAALFFFILKLLFVHSRARTFSTHFEYNQNEITTLCNIQSYEMIQSQQLQQIQARRGDLLDSFLYKTCDIKISILCETFFAVFTTCQTSKKGERKVDVLLPTIPTKGFQIYGGHWLI